MLWNILKKSVPFPCGVNCFKAQFPFDRNRFYSLSVQFLQGKGSITALSESLSIVLSILNIGKQCLQVCQSQREEFKHLTTSTSRGDNDKSLAVQFNFNLNFVLMYIVYS